MKAWAIAVLAGVTAASIAAAEPDIQTPEGRNDARQKIEAQRNAADNTFNERDAECQKRFVVTSCRAQVRLERIRSQDEFKRQLTILNKLDRQESAAKQLKKLDEKLTGSSSSR